MCQSLAPDLDTKRPGDGSRLVRARGSSQASCDVGCKLRCKRASEYPKEYMALIRRALPKRRYPRICNIRFDVQMDYKLSKNIDK
jgi:hypothetical protein